MANATTVCTNQDYTVIRILFYTSGTENMRLFQGQSDNLTGPEGTQFSYAWKDRDETITDNEMQQYGTGANYGDSLTFGNPAGRIP